MKYVICLVVVIVFITSVFYSNYFSDIRKSLIELFPFLSNQTDRVNQLLIENESLKSKIFEIEKLQGSSFSEGKFIYKPAKIYSTYPFSHHSILGINVGSLDGIEKTMVVAVSEGVLIGQIIDVYPHSSLVRTIFDSDFKIAVRVGNSGVNALLEGGNTPTVTMIKKDSNIKVFDPVYSAAEDFPYGMKIGEIKEVINESEGSPFKKASLETNYNSNEIQDVFVITNYKFLRLK